MKLVEHVAIIRWYAEGKAQSHDPDPASPLSVWIALLHYVLLCSWSVYMLISHVWKSILWVQ